jgi:4a-hydroxytetrahydrobiopterin dehydratase
MSADDIERENLGHWRLAGGQLRARFLTRTFTRGVEFIDLIGTAADQADHHPDVDLRFGHVTIAMNSHDVEAITARDIRLARAISAIADELGNSSEPVTSDG